MEKEKKINRKDLLIIGLIACLSFLSIAYATVSVTLNITNSLTVKAYNWDIHFENLVHDEPTGNNTAKIINNAHIETDTTKISGLQVAFKKPGDSVSYTFDIKNAGDIDAEISSVITGVPNCTPESLICKDIEYNLKYADGSNIQVHDKLLAGQTKKVKLTINYKLSSTYFEKNDINVSGLDSIIVYSQK